MAVGSFSAGLSGLSANSTYLSVIGNNLANINTVGFKASAVSFADLVSQTVGSTSANPTQVGLGVVTGSISPVVSQGNIENAKRSTGPRTAEGKNQSRRNALKHGLAGSGTCTLGLLKDEIAVEYHGLAEIARPQNLLEQRLVEQAAVGSIQFLPEKPKKSEIDALVRAGQQVSRKLGLVGGRKAAS